MQPDFIIDSVRFAQPTAFDYWDTALTLSFPTALWRLPNHHDKHLLVSFDKTLPRVSIDLEELPAGFAISPFNSIDIDQPGAPATNSAQTLFLRADIHTVFSETRPEQNTITDGNGTNEMADHQFRAVLADRVKRGANEPKASAPPTLLADPKAREQYLQGVANAVDAMQRGELRKVVLSRTKQLAFAEAPNAVALFNQLCAAYPTAFVSAIYLPETGQIWISATPERLVSSNGNGIFQTMSLAGTQSAQEPDGTPKRLAYALWSQKEIEEQALVSRYIIECFKRIRLREYLEEGPKTIIAGNLMHLSTCFTVDTHAVSYPQLATVMLRLLHPTSAVCGMPRNRAYSFIKQHETHDREFYAGFLGPINISSHDKQAAAYGETFQSQETNLFVHIRCMKLEGNRGTLYAGAGLTEDSIPEREWQETEIKCQTLLNVFDKAD